MVSQCSFCLPLLQAGQCCPPRRRPLPLRVLPSSMATCSDGERGALMDRDIRQQHWCRSNTVCVVFYAHFCMWRGEMRVSPFSRRVYLTFLFAVRYHHPPLLFRWDGRSAPRPPIFSYGLTGSQMSSKGAAGSVAVASWQLSQASSAMRRTSRAHNFLPWRHRAGARLCFAPSRLCRAQR